MSDNGSIDSSPRRSSSSHINNPRNLPLDFPIRTGTLNAGGSVNIHLAELIAEFEELHRNITEREADTDRATRISRPAVNPNIRLSAVDHQGSPIPAQNTQGADGTGPLVAMGPIIPTQSTVVKKPVTTLINKLSQTSYADKRDTAEKTLEYITVQRAVLDYLGKRAADTLSPRQACAWTRAIEPMTKKPAAKDALRLCYYMRSQGFDTYAELKERNICLFVADQDGKDDGGLRERDLPYWKQDFSTNQVLYSVSSETRSTTGRRNAIVPGHTPPVRGAHAVDAEAMFSGMRGSDPWGSVLESIDGPEEDEEYVEGVDWAGETDVLGAILTEARNARAHQAAPAQQPQTQEQAQRRRLEVRMAEAQTNLDHILSAENTNPGLVEGAIARVEGLQRLLDQV